MGGSDRVGRVSGENIRVKLIEIHNGGGAEGWYDEGGGSERGSELFLSEDSTIIERIITGTCGTGVTATCKCVGLGSKLPGTEADDEMELGEVFGPAGLTAGKKFGRSKVFQILVVGDDVNRSAGTFQIMAPDAEGFMNG